MNEHTHLPEINQLSVLAATILLAYALTPFIKIPEAAFSVELPFGVFSFTFNFLTIVSVLVATLAGFGMDWLLHTHPHREARFPLLSSLLPALTAWVIGIPLSTLTYGITWWGLFGMGGLLLVLVFVAEYIVVDFADVRFGPAAAGLSALSFALFLILAITVRAAGLRLYLALPALAGPLLLISIRTLYLRSGGRWNLAWAFCISAIVMQIALSLQYLPVSPLGYGLYLVGPAYALTQIGLLAAEGRPFRTVWLGPVVIMVILVLLAFLLGG